MILVRFFIKWVRIRKADRESIQAARKPGNRAVRATLRDTSRRLDHSPICVRLFYANAKCARRGKWTTCEQVSPLRWKVGSIVWFGSINWT